MTKRISTTAKGFHMQIRDNLTGPRATGLKRVDIASFRIGQLPAWVDFLVSLDRLPSSVPVRMLIGVNPDPNNGGLTPSRTKRGPVHQGDPCIATLEEINSKTSARVQIRILDDFHTKMWLFTRRNGRSTALVGSRNLNMSKWSELMIEVNKDYIPGLTEVFEREWQRATVLPAAGGFISAIMTGKHTIK